MLHRVPSRQPRHVLLGIACVGLFILCSFVSCYYFIFAPNREVSMLSAGAALLLLWPLVSLGLRLFGERVVQVEHAGVAVSFHCMGVRLSRKVWTAAHVLHFDWERTPDGLFALRLLLLKNDGRRGFTTVLHTDSAYALAAVWRDLELHYPGSGLREERPSVAEPAERGTRSLSLVLIFAGVAVTVWLWPQMFRPFKVSAMGQVNIARVEAIEWGQTKTSGSPYHLRVLPDGADKSVRTASSFYAHSGRVPLPGQQVPVLWAEGLPCYLPGEVLPFLMPLPVWGLCLVMVWGGIWGLMRSGHRPH